MEKGGAENPNKINKYACACSIVASMISIIFGYDTGVMSGAMIFVKEEFHISDVKTGVLAGILNLCALVGSLSAGRTSDYVGRRYTIVIASIIFLLGSVIMGYGPNYAILLAGRCVAGVGVGFALMIAPVYSVEVSSPSTRGFLTSLPEIGISTGILLGYLSNYVFSGLPLRLGWRIMLGIAAIPSLFLAIGILKMPESPRWLIMKGRLGEAKEIMFKVSNSPQEAEFRLREVKKSVGIDENCDDDIVKIPTSAKSQREGIWKELLLKPTPSLRWILFAGVGIHFFEHATGIEAVILYSHKIFAKAGVHDHRKQILATCGVGLTKFTFIVVSTFLIDRVGRRKLLLTSVSGMVLTLTGLGIFLTVAEHSDGKLIWALVLSIITTYAFVMFFNIGLGPVTWVYSAEIFPLKYRALGAGIGVAVNRLMNATVSMSFLSISNAITTGGAFFMFAGISVIALTFFYFFLPETKGLSLEEMEALFTKGSHSKNPSKEVEIGKR
ncbi:putative polyol transporter 6 [Capsicum chacoense]|uniref:Polyol transporter 5 n=1 Tax=Capsicum annuum TaxID=4072 RepID=A0A1U8FDG6_CAPAN|nr:probable polyol transporter 6 [Capsicum annuum]KAF3639040.1 Polyol transporter 5 [Capsicum annuum]PHT89044.1 Polyol transporter 5 [Capsicum annuum]